MFLEEERRAIASGGTSVSGSDLRCGFSAMISIAVNDA